ncbi:peptidylprolyl isomerase [Pedobacter gandavensis]|uniref:peptidylprolyl isomerase n=1 Tax=Pedobacter gandavensis TaxID=2679963 RepID=A0ABR6ESI2_9SPHI|nr:peptidylprolyl isomerase [Pedobacter gandavensis]MBB2148224.1 peptidylprolyl isomerase [Pedobacter gandavensis]
MKSIFTTLTFVLITVASYAQSRFVRLETNKGNITLMLYDETPKHRDAFLKSIKKGLYDHAAFNRVIKAFVSQGGELDETILDREKLSPEKPLARIPAEIVPELFHKKGALGAGRNDNLEHSSYLTQIYLSVGKPQTDAELNAIEKKKGHQYSPKQREIYKTLGGIPRLDLDYTVFGQIVEGMEVADAINSVPTDKNDLPLQAITFTPKVLSKKESAKLLEKLPKN